MITINENFKINTDGNGCTLIQKLHKTRIGKESKEEEAYTTDQEYHFLTVEQCLRKYVDLVAEPCKSVLEVLAAIKGVKLEISLISKELSV